MSLWGNKDQSNSAPKSIGRLFGKRPTANTNANLYANTSANKSVYGVDVNEAKANDGITHPGWIVRTVGTGGRAGRVFNETLVAMGSMIGDGTDDAAFKNVAIKVTAQPSNANTTGGGPTSFTVGASASPNTPLTYVWSANTGSGFNPLTDTAPYSNTATATLYIANTTGLNGAQFKVSVSAASANTKTSKSATLSVQ